MNPTYSGKDGYRSSDPSIMDLIIPPSTDRHCRCRHPHRIGNLFSVPLEAVYRFSRRAGSDSGSPDHRIGRTSD